MISGAPYRKPATNRQSIDAPIAIPEGLQEGFDGPEVIGTGEIAPRNVLPGTPLHKHLCRDLLYFASAVVFTTEDFSVAGHRMPPMSDQAIGRGSEMLASSLCRADESVGDARFTRLYHATLPRVYSFVRSQVPTVDVAGEVVSRIFLKAYYHRRNAPADEMGAIWVFRIAHTTLIDYWRTEVRRQAVTVSVDELADIADPVASPEALYATKEYAVLLLRVVADLSEDDRAVIALKFAGQRTNREIAAIMGISEAAVSMRLLRTLRRLRHRLTELGIR